MVDLSLNSTTNDLTFFGNLLKMLEKLNDQIQKTTLLKKEEQDLSILQKKLEHICQLVDICCNLFLSLSELCNRQISIEEESSLYSIIKCIPSTIELFVTLLKCQDVADSSDVAIARSKIAQISMHIICKYFHSDFVSNERRFKIIFHNIDKPEFIVRLDDKINLDRELSKLLAKQICTEQQIQLIIGALQKAYSLRRNSILKGLGRQGILQFIGYPINKHIDDQIQELSEIMPDLSRQQLHLCLRHFGYDLEKTLEGLCEREQLPFDMKILLQRAKDELENAPQGGRNLKMTNDAKIADMHEIAPHFGGENLQHKVEKIEQLIAQISIDEASIKMDGREFKRLGTKEEEILTLEQCKELKAASMKCAERIEENDGEDGEEISGEEAEQRMELKLAAEVGQSGRFNRLRAENIYDDEYDDTYEHAQLYTKVDLGADTADEKEIGNLVNTSEDKQGTSQNNPQRREIMAQKKKWNPQQRGGQIVKNAQELSKDVQQKNKQGAKFSSNSEGNSTKMTVEQRRQKEQNKGKERQKGADRKMKI